jgi:hypothetical protein
VSWAIIVSVIAVHANKPMARMNFFIKDALSIVEFTFFSTISKANPLIISFF